jgi:hypothetical protein
MNPQIALELADQRQRLLRRESVPRSGRLGISASFRVAANSAVRLRRGIGWLLVELGLKLALSREGAAEARARRAGVT